MGEFCINQSIAAPYLAAIEVLFAGQHTQERRFASAIAADQAQAFPGLNRQVDLVQKGDVTEGEACVANAQQAHTVRGAMLATTPETGWFWRRGEYTVAWLLIIDFHLFITHSHHNAFTTQHLRANRVTYPLENPRSLQ